MPINQYTYFLNKITDLERRLKALESSNQVKTLNIGDSVIINGAGDGSIYLGETISLLSNSTGTSSINIANTDVTDPDDIFLKLTNLGINLYAPSSSTLNSYINFYQSTLKIGDFSYNNYASGGVNVCDMLFRSFQENRVDSDTYTTMAVYKPVSVGGREGFLQIFSSYRSSAFSNFSIGFSLDGQSRSWGITADDTSGHGYMTIPTKASDPSGSIAWGALYYNTTTNKLKILEGGSWKTVTTS